MNQAEENPYASPLTEEPLSEGALLYLKERRWEMVKILDPVAALGWALGIMGVGRIIARETNFEYDYVILLLSVIIAMAGSVIISSLIENKVEKVLGEIRERLRVFEESLRES